MTRQSRTRSPRTARTSQVVALEVRGRELGLDQDQDQEEAVRTRRHHHPVEVQALTMGMGMAPGASIQVKNASSRNLRLRTRSFSRSMWSSFWMCMHGMPTVIFSFFLCSDGSKGLYIEVSLDLVCIAFFLRADACMTEPQSGQCYFIYCSPTFSDTILEVYCSDTRAWECPSELQVQSHSTDGTLIMVYVCHSLLSFLSLGFKAMY